MGKVKFGLSAFEYGKVVNDLIEGATKKATGLETANIHITNELVKIMADDGPYVVVPFLTGSSVRGLAGTIVDGVADPVYWMTYNDANYSAKISYPYI